MAIITMTHTTTTTHTITTAATITTTPIIITNNVAAWSFRDSLNYNVGVLPLYLLQLFLYVIMYIMPLDFSNI